MTLLFLTCLSLSLATSYSSPVTGEKVTCPEGWFDENDLDMGKIINKTHQKQTSLVGIITDPHRYWYLFLGCLLMHHKELNHKVHTWLKSDEFCREFGENSRMVEVHSLEQKQFLDQLVGWFLQYLIISILI